MGGGGCLMGVETPISFIQYKNLMEMIAVCRVIKTHKNNELMSVQAVLQLLSIQSHMWLFINELPN